MNPDGTPGMTPPQKVQKEYIKKDQPFIKWRNPFDIFLDVDVPRRKDGRYMIVRAIVTFDYVMNMSKIPEEMKAKIKPTLRPEDIKDDYDFSSKVEKDRQSEKEWVELLWIWCRETEKRYLMTPSIPGEYLLEEEWPYHIEFEDDPFPVTILDGKTDINSPYSFSEIRPIWAHIQERNRVRGTALVHMKRSIPKYIGTKANTRAQMSKLMNARSDEYTEVNNPDAIRLAPVAELPIELYKWDEVLKNDILNVSSLFEFQNDSIANTATEASLIEGRSSVRKRKRTQEIEKFVVAVLAKVGMLCQQFQDQAVAVEITQDNNTDWLMLSKEQIEGEFRYEMEPGIMEYKNEALRKQQILKFSELMQGNPNVNQRKLAESLAKVFDLKAEDILLPPDQVPVPSSEPKIGIKDLDLMTIPDPSVQSAIVQAALQQNDVQMQQPQPGAPPQLDMMGGQDMPQDIEPMGGKVPLPPVLGQQEVQGASMENTNYL